MAVTLKPVPISSGLGKGFWVDLKAAMATAISAIEENDQDDSSTSSTFDETATSVDDFLAAVDDIIDSLSA